MKTDITAQYSKYSLVSKKKKDYNNDGVSAYPILTLILTEEYLKIATNLSTLNNCLNFSFFIIPKTLFLSNTKIAVL